jgi:hypothetical protein
VLGRQILIWIRGFSCGYAPGTKRIPWPAPVPAGVLALCPLFSCENKPLRSFLLPLPGLAWRLLLAAVRLRTLNTTTRTGQEDACSDPMNTLFPPLVTPLDGRKTETARTTSITAASGRTAQGLDVPRFPSPAERSEREASLRTESETVSAKGAGMALRHLMDWIAQQGGRITLPDIPDSLSLAGQKVVGTYNECVEDAEIEYSAQALEAFARQMVEQGQLLLYFLKRR